MQTAIKITIHKKLVQLIFFKTLLVDGLITPDQFKNESFRSKNELTDDQLEDVETSIMVNHPKETIEDVVIDAIIRQVGPLEDLKFGEGLKLVK